MCQKTRLEKGKIAMSFISPDVHIFLTIPDLEHCRKGEKKFA
jgi:hypothetical protein